MFKGAIFDMDGVLVDNMMIHMEAFGELSRRYGVEFDRAYVLSLAGMGNAELFGEVFPHEVIDTVGVDALAQEKEAIYREIYAPKLVATPGLVDFLKKLKAANVKTAVGTSAPKINLDFVLDGLGIRCYFDEIVTSDMVTNCKPDPEIYLVAAAKLGLKPAECLVFEDAVVGIQAAHAAGIKVVALSTSVDKAKLEAQSGVALVISDFTHVEFSELKVLV